MEASVLFISLILTGFRKLYKVFSWLWGREEVWPKNVLFHPAAFGPLVPKEKRLPVGFEQIVGQSRAIRALQEAYARQRIPNAYLFAGPAGVGKSTTAQILAKLINCEGPRADNNPCDVCASCRKIEHGNHMDVTILEPDNNIFKIKQIRGLQRALRFPPQDGRMRVITLDGVEKMNQEAANAFLKILEEPPPNNLFVLVCSNPSLLLPTILSRCQRVPFAPIERDLLQNLLVERHGFDQIRAELASGLSEGSVARAIALDSNLTSEERRFFLQGLSGLHRQPKGTTLALELAQQLKDKGDQLPLYFDLLRTWYRDLLFLCELETPARHLIHRDLQSALERHQAMLNTDQIYQAIRAIEHATHALQRRAAPLLTLENLFLSLQFM